MGSEQHRLNPELPWINGSVGPSRAAQGWDLSALPQSSCCHNEGSQPTTAQATPAIAFLY